MEKIKWTFDVSTEYDLDEFVRLTQQYIDDCNITEDNLDAAKTYCRQQIYSWLTFEEDLVFYSFKNAQYDEIMNKVFENVTLQGRLF